VTAVAVALLAVASIAGAQAVEGLPGYVDLEQLGLFAGGEVEVDIDLRGSMAKIVAAATSEEDPEFSAAMEKIQRIRVQVGSAGELDATAVRSAIDAATKRLEQSGWYRMVSVRDEEESVHVLALENSGVLQGLTAFVQDGSGEVVLVNIAGEMSPEMIGSLVSNIDHLEGLTEELQAGSTDR
jgi:hypothetical protein